MIQNCRLRSTFGRSDDNSTQGRDVVYVIECLSVHSVKASRMSSNLSGENGWTGWSTQTVWKITVSLLTGLIRELRWETLFIAACVSLLSVKASRMSSKTCPVWMAGQVGAHRRCEDNCVSSDRFDSWASIRFDSWASMGNSFLSQLVCLFWPQALTRFEIVCCSSEAPALHRNRLDVRRDQKSKCVWTSEVTLGCYPTHMNFVSMIWRSGLIDGT